MSEVTAVHKTESEAGVCTHGEIVWRFCCLHTQASFSISVTLPTSSPGGLLVALQIYRSDDYLKDGDDDTDNDVMDETSASSERSFVVTHYMRACRHELKDPLFGGSFFFFFFFFFLFVCTFPAY